MLLGTKKQELGARSRIIPAAVIAILALGATACGGSSSSSSSASGGSSSGGSSTGSSSKHVNLAFELVLTGVKFAQDASLGVRTAASDAGNVSAQINGPTSINPVVAQSQASSAATQSPDGMAIDPFTPDLWQHTLSTVSQQVKNLLVWNDKPVVTPDQLGSTHVKTYVGISYASFGRDLAVGTIKNGGLSASATGNVLLGQCVPGTAGVLAEETAAFVKVIHQMLPKTNVIQFNSQVVPSANTVAWTSELQAHPNPVLALGTCDQDGTSLYLVKKKTGQHFVAAGIDLTPEALKGVADGTLADAMVENYYVQGYVTASLLAKAARGTPLPQGWIDTGYTLITKSSVGALTQAIATDSGTIAYWKPKVDAIMSNVAAVTKPLAEAWK